MKKEIVIILAIIALSCHKEETTEETDKTALRLVTGINLRGNIDDIPLKLGNPNVFIDNKFVIYPNPAPQALNVVSQENVTDVWFVRTNPEKIHQEVNFSAVLNTNLYSEQQIISNSNLSVNGQSSNNFMINIATLEKGYYKVFVKIDGTTYWDNFYKCDNGFDQEQLSLMTNFWN